MFSLNLINKNLVCLLIYTTFTSSLMKNSNAFLERIYFFRLEIFNIDQDGPYVGQIFW